VPKPTVTETKLEHSASCRSVCARDVLLLPLRGKSAERDLHIVPIAGTMRTERRAYSARPPNGSNVKLQAAFTRERTGGAPLAAMHTQLTLSVCKRRDAVRLAQHQPARPAGAAFGGLSASALSWAAPRQTPSQESFSRP